MKPLLKDSVALITGASRGIGAAVAREFARQGAHVVLVARTVGGLEELDDAIQKDARELGTGGSASLVPLDLMEFAKIDQLAASLHGRFGKLDVLVGNAAMLGGLRPVTHVTDGIWDKVMGLNVTANWRLIRAMDPLLRLSPAGRAMFVSSGVVDMALPFYGVYATSKAALEKLVQTYAAENAHGTVKANLIDPGIVRTAMRAEAMPGEDPLSLPEPAEITGVFVDLALPSLKDTGQVFSAYRKKSAA